MPRLASPCVGGQPGNRLSRTSGRSRVRGSVNGHNQAMMKYWEFRGQADWWPGVVARSLKTDFEFETCCYLHDMAKAGNWRKVLELLEQPELKGVVNVNQMRPESNEGLSVLHHAVENLAPEEVIDALLKRGAFRSLRDRNNRTAFETARMNQATPSILTLLEPVPSPLSEDRQAVLTQNVTDVIDAWLQPLFGKQNPRQLLRYPPVGVLHESPGRELWLQVPTMMGGLRLILQRGYLELLIGYRRFQDEGVHVTVNGFVITQQGSALVYESSGITQRSDPDKAV
jgi:hypothetical protein